MSQDHPSPDDVSRNDASRNDSTDATTAESTTIESTSEPDEPPVGADETPLGADGLVDPATLTDPSTLRDNPAVSHERVTVSHESEDFCGLGTAGRAIVGVTNANGAVLAYHDRETRGTYLPNETVDPDGDFVAVAEDIADRELAVTIDLVGVDRARTISHTLEDADEPFETTTQVLLHATTTTDDPEPAASTLTNDADANEIAVENAGEDDGECPDADDYEPVLTWLSAFPADATNADNLSGEDVRTILERAAGQ